MKIIDILEILNNISPFDLQENWDNSGLLLGEINDEVANIVLSLDVDFEMLEKVKNNSLIITHHPLIFKGLKQLNTALFPANLIGKMFQKNIKLIAMHTNFDKTDLNQFVLSEVLKMKIVENINDFILVAEPKITRNELFKILKENLNLKMLKTVNVPDKINRLALTTGSGGSLISELNNKNIDLFLTGDIKYHEAMEAKLNNLGLVDIGHFESEIFFGDILQRRLTKFNLKVEIINSVNPFKIV